ncbi:hypothetical protein CP10139811_1038 [Chlamydia ibidis]|uniref:Uncharacterized protein n=2 Tax=Chlamydia ibidis TaxID=1405396 RepID=S7KLS9_9CHLA|nr:hypothetical protein CP10139811_1038 [Chlamydia ibidis]EQM63012.1 hypothetical protein H359_0357 [Chlamydia ibidis 10-1398/6]
MLLKDSMELKDPYVIDKKEVLSFFKNVALSKTQARIES